MFTFEPGKDDSDETYWGEEVSFFYVLPSLRSFFLQFSSIKWKDRDFFFLILNSKIIELSGTELQNLRICLQKLQLQNWNLAQSNSQMLAVCWFCWFCPSMISFLKYLVIDCLFLVFQELNLGRDKVSLFGTFYSFQTTSVLLPG